MKRHKNPSQHISKSNPEIHEKRECIHDQMPCIIGMQDWLNTQKSINVIRCINRIKEQKPCNILNRFREALDKI